MKEKLVLNLKFQIKLLCSLSVILESVIGYDLFALLKFADLTSYETHDLILNDFMLRKDGHSHLTFKNFGFPLDSFGTC